MVQLPKPKSAEDFRNLPRQDAWKDDPTIPRVVTIRPDYGGCFKRFTEFPDGSATEETIHADGTEVLPTPMRSAAEVARADAWTGVEKALRRLAETRAGRLVHDGAGWWAFDGTLWRRRRDVTREMRAALREAGTAEPWPALVAAVEQLARQDPSLTTCPALAAAGAWDPDPMRLGTPGGTVDLATGALAPADPADRITRATSVAPAATADCPLWRRFLAEAMEGDADRVRFLQRFCGYALTGETSEHVLLFGLGEGGNGKSVFANIVRTILGTYAAVAAPDLLAGGAGARGRQLHSAEVAMLAGARLVTASETEEGRTWADGRLKLLTGGDPVTARFAGRDPFTFTPRFKLLVTGNHMPALRCVDAALRRRLRLVPFAHTPAVPDRRLEAKLRDESPAILRWMIEGCVAWAAEGPDGGLSGGRRDRDRRLPRRGGPRRPVPRRMVRPRRDLPGELRRPLRRLVRLRPHPRRAPRHPAPPRHPPRPPRAGAGAPAPRKGVPGGAFAAGRGAVRGGAGGADWG